ncbi:glycosyltransferase [Rhizobium sp. A37_96]
MKNIDTGLIELSRQLAHESDIHYGLPPEISVIIPCFNGEEYIHICLESLAKQTLPQSRFEVICIDDCSPDRTGDVITSFEGRIQNLRLITHKTNRKQGGARNTGIDAAIGRFVIFLDSDDFLRLDALEILINAAAPTTDIAMGQLLKVRYDQPYRPQPTDTRRLEKDVDVAHSALTNKLGWFPVAMLISRELLNTNRIRFVEGVFFEDIQFCIDLFLTTTELKIIPDQIYMYVQRDTSTVNAMTEKKLGDSARAMSAVFHLSLRLQDGVETFRPIAISWLRLQASRIRDGGASLSDRKHLGQYLLDKTKEHGIDAYVRQADLDELLKIASATPRLPADHAAIGAITCTSPWGGRLESDFAGAVIFFCEVNYHIRSAAPVARALKRIGFSSIIVDAAKSKSFSTNRPLPESERILYADLDIREFDIKENLPFSTDAAAFVFMNDLTYTKRLILENFGFGVPTFGFYEGINDDWNLDRKLDRRPYRSVDFLLLPGTYQCGFYQDRECRIVGLPNVRSLLSKPYVASRKRRAVINVNFTYGVLEDRRDEYVTTTVQACREIGLDYVITQHPADKADLSAYNITKTSVYDLLDEGAILISRFSTTILEALAMGRPVVYHNPIKEKVPKFSQPLGAYAVSDSTESLKNALKRELQFVDAEGDVRARAKLFLHFHCHTGTPEEPEELAAKAIRDVISEPQRRFAFKIGQPHKKISIVSDAATKTNLNGSSLRTPLSGAGHMPTTITHTKPNSAQSLAATLREAVAIRGWDSALITSIASALLLDGTEALEVLRTNDDIQLAVDRMLSLRPEGDELRAHYYRVLDFVEKKSRSSRISA